MKRLALAIGILALAAPLALAQSSTWVSDPYHSEVDFSVRHMSIANVHGRIGGVAAKLLLNEANITQSSVTVTIDVTTIDTGVAPRDTHLKTPDFFDVAKYPTATFVSTGVTKTANGLAVAGNFTLHGVTKPIVLQVQGPNGPVTGLDKKPHTGFSATTAIRRDDYGIGPKFPDAFVGENIQLTIELDVAKQ
jgi:polyisoprenoid-binding protein YceI